MIRALVLGLAILAGVSTAATAVEFSNPAFAPAGGETSVPIGHYQFCQERPDECGPSDEPIPFAALTAERWAQLISVNNELNAAIAPVGDEELYGVEERWVYPSTAGDCEDYVLAKRRALALAGWPPSVLLISVVRQLTGEGHAILLVRTDRGDLVLDNQDGDIHLWNETPYIFVKRQSQEDAGRWVAINDDRTDFVTSAH